jgi:integrase
MTTKRRGHGEGMAPRLRDDGRWEARVDLGYGLAGTRRRRSVFGKTRRECADKLKEILADQQKGTLLTDTKRQTVTQYLDDWLLNSVKPTVRASTYASYKQLCALYIIPSLGRIQLTQLAPQQIRAFLNELSKRQGVRTGKALSARTVQYCHAILRRSLGQAVRLGLLARNPVALIDPPKATRSEAKYLTPDQARTFLASVKGDRLECLYTLAITLGLRRGELLGLTWDSIDTGECILAVSKTLQRVEGKLQFVDPKTARSKRVVVLSNAAMTALKAHRIRQLEERLLAGSRWEEYNLVFPNTEGKPYDGGNMVKEFHKALKRASLPDTNFHSLRHTCASLLLAQGVHMRVVMELLGHSQIAMTMDLYSHVVPELKREAADRMDALFTAQT